MDVVFQLRVLLEVPITPEEGVWMKTHLLCDLLPRLNPSKKITVSVLNRRTDLTIMHFANSYTDEYRVHTAQYLQQHYSN